MLESIINPKKAKREPWQMFFVGFLYAALSMILCYSIFNKDPVLSEYMGIFVITFCVIFSMPFVYYTIKNEEEEDVKVEEERTLLKEHGRAIMAFLWLFLGFVVAFSIGYALIPNGENLFNAQIKVFCQINRPANFEDCIQQYGIEAESKITGAFTSKEKVFAIFSNNVYVLIFTLVLSLIFGAGAIFILAWNASVIAAAIGIFAKSQISNIPSGLARYLIHGIPEISAYFIAALAGGILGFAIIKGENKTERFWNVLQDSLNLIIIAIVILFVSALIEVFITPSLF
jgi:uncharacterized membrane protein SpoIIM required for sporulation